MAINCMDLYIGTVCLDGDGSEWVYDGAAPSPPDDNGMQGTYYKFIREAPSGFGTDVTYYMGDSDTLYTHHNGTEVGTAARNIKRVKC